MTKKLSSKIFSAVSFIKSHVLKKGYVSYTCKQMLSHLESFYIITPGLCDPLCMKHSRRRNPGLGSRGVGVKAFQWKGRRN